MHPDQSPPELPEEVDVLVVGSGAAGLTAALTVAVSGRSVLLIEAADRFGGTSTLSGGRVWLPPGDQPEDSVLAAVGYLSAVFGNDYQPMIDTFVSTARRMAKFIEDHSRHRFVVCPRYPDYHPDLSGATAGGRAYDAAPIRLGDLVAEAADIQLPPGYLPITHAEWEAWRFPDAFDWDLIDTRRKQGIVTNGASLVASLIDGSVRAGARLIKRAALVDIEQRADTDPIRAHVTGPDLDATVVAGALVLASGGFDADTELRTALLPRGLGASAAIPTNTGIALRLAREKGFEVANLSQGWWMPLVAVPDDTVAGVPYPRALVRERGVPHQIVVNRAGKRFVNEASPYHEFGDAMQEERDGDLPNKEAWLIFDEQFRARYPFPGLNRSGSLPDHIQEERSLGGLAVRLGIDAAALTSTVNRWNGMCRAGRDLDFSRGENLYDRYYGDPRHANSPNLGTIERPPFYAAPIVSGTVGSKGGPVTTTDGQIVDGNGRPRPGWYAAGNAAAFWTADGYPGPGATLGIGMTFAYRAALTASRSLIQSPSATR